MKCTPANTITSASVAAACCDRPSESPTIVGHVLHLGHLVVVGQDHGVALACQRSHLVLHGLDIGFGQDADGGTSSAMSSARTECVSAPTEIASTPVSATSRMVSMVMPPRRLQACASGRRCHRPAQLGGRHVVEQDHVRAGVERLLAARPACRPRPRPARSGWRRRTRSDCGRHAAGNRHVVVLDQDGVVQAGAVVGAAAAGHGVLVQRAQAGGRLARVQQLHAGSGHQVGVAPCRRGDAGHPLQQVERGALPCQQRPHRRVQPGHHLRRVVRSGRRPPRVARYEPPGRARAAPRTPGRVRR